MILFTSSTSPERSIALLGPIYILILVPLWLLIKPDPETVLASQLSSGEDINVAFGQGSRTCLP